MRMLKERKILKLFRENAFDALPAYYYLKDRDSSYIAANEKVVKVIGFDTNTTLLGKSDYEMPFKDQAQNFIHQDQIVLNGDNHISIDFLCNANGDSLCIFNTKTPVLDARNKIIAVFGEGQLLNTNNFRALLQQWVLLYPKLYDFDRYNNGCSYNNIHFTVRQLQIISGVLRGYSDKSTASALGISDKTVSWHKSAVKKKLKVYNNKQIIQRAFEFGFIDLMFMEID